MKSDFAIGLSGRKKFGPLVGPQFLPSGFLTVGMAHM